MFERIKHMLIKEFIQVFRDPKMRGIVFVMPVVQVLVFGYTVPLDVKHIAPAASELDNTVASRELAARFENSRTFELVASVESDRTAAMSGQGVQERVDDGGGANQKQKTQ